MTRTPVLLPLALLPLLMPLAACSRGRALDDGPIARASAGGIAPAASSARVATPGSSPPSIPGHGTTGGPASPTSSFSGGGGHPSAHVHDDGATVLPAGLPAEVIRRIVRQNFGRFRLCYENGLLTDPALEGSVRTRFVIEPDGAVGSVSDAGSLLSDAGVVACVERAFGNLSFPQPSAGAVTVTYSLSFTSS
jgi:hypothetical protein